MTEGSTHSTPSPGWTPVPGGRWARSWFFLGRVWELFRGDRSLIAVAAVGTLGNVLATVLVFGLAAWLMGGDDERLVLGLSGAVLAFPVTVVSTYCNVALVRMAQARFEGRRCTARQGFAAATRRLPAILAWSALSVGVGAALDWVAEHVPGAGALAAWLLGLAWSLATMFAVPVLALEDAGARAAARRSVELFRARWGEGVNGTISVAALTLLAGAPAVVALGIGIAIGGGAGIALALAGGALLGVVTTATRATNELFALALYRDAVHGEPTLGLGGAHLDAFVELKDRKRRWGR
jgi:Family of unknown function (DUF6159)